MFKKESWPSRSHWVSDEAVKACSECHTPFSLVVRRHHCRLCGGLFCRKCTSSSHVIPRAQQKPEPERVCDKCYQVLSKSSMSRERGPLDATPIELRLVALESPMRKQLYQESLSTNKPKLADIAEKIKDLGNKISTADVLATRCKLWVQREELQMLLSADSLHWSELEKILNCKFLTTFFIDLSGLFQKLLLFVCLDAAGLTEGEGKRTLRLSGAKCGVIKVSWPGCVGLLCRRIGLTLPCTDSAEIVHLVSMGSDRTALYLTQRYSQQIKSLSTDGARILSHCVVKAFVVFLDTLENGAVSKNVVAHCAHLPQLVQYAVDHYAELVGVDLPTNISTQSAWTDVGIFRETGLTSEDGGRFHRPGVPLPLKYGFRVGTMEEVHACGFMRESNGSFITVQTVPLPPSKVGVPRAADIERIISDCEDALCCADLAKHQFLESTAFGKASMTGEISQPKLCAFHTRIRAKLLLIWASRYVLDEPVDPTQVDLRLVGHPVPPLPHFARFRAQLEIVSYDSDRSVLQHMQELAHMVALSLTQRYRAVVLALTEGSGLVFAECCVARFVYLCEGLVSVAEIFDMVPRLGEVALNLTVVTSVSRLYLTTEEGAVLKEHNLHIRGAIITPDGIRNRRQTIYYLSKNSTTEGKYPDLVGSGDEVAFEGFSTETMDKGAPLRGSRSSESRFSERLSTTLFDKNAPVKGSRSSESRSSERLSTAMFASPSMSAPSSPTDTRSLNRERKDAPPPGEPHLKRCTVRLAPQQCNVGDVLDVFFCCKDSTGLPCPIDLERSPLVLLCEGSHGVLSLRDKKLGGTALATTLVPDRGCDRVVVMVQLQGAMIVSNHIIVKAGCPDWETSELFVPSLCTAGETIQCRLILRDSLGNRAVGPVQPEDFILRCPDTEVGVVKATCESEFKFTLTPFGAGVVEGSVTLHSVLRTFQLTVRPSVVHFGNSVLCVEESEVTVGAKIYGSLYLRDAYGNHVEDTAIEDIRIWYGPNEPRPPLDIDNGSRLDCFDVSSGDEDTLCQLKLVLPGEYLFSVVPVAVGSIKLVAKFVRTNEKLFARVNVVPSKDILGVFAEKSSVRVVPQHIRAGTTAIVTVMPRDEYGNIIDLTTMDPSMVRVIVQHPNGTASTVTLSAQTVHAHSVTLTLSSIIACELVVTARLGECEVRSDIVTVSPYVLSWETSTVACATTGQVGEPVMVTVTPRDAYNNLLSVSACDFILEVLHESTTYLPLINKATVTESGDVEFTFVSTKMGRVSVEITVAGKASPVKTILLGSGTVDWKSSIVKADNASCIAGDSTTFCIATHDRYGNLTTGLQGTDLEVSVTSAKGKLITASSVTGTGSLFFFTCILTEMGTAVANVSLKAVTKSCEIRVLPAGASLQHCSVRTEPEKLQAGDSLSCIISAWDRFGNPTTLKGEDFTISANVKSIEDEPCEAIRKKVENVTASAMTVLGANNFCFTIRPTMAGSMSVFIQQGCDSSPKDFTLFVEPAGIDWKMCRVACSSMSIIAGNAITGTIFLCDAFENPIVMNASEIALTCTNEGEVTTDLLQPTLPGSLEQLRFSYTPKKMGRAMILASYRSEVKNVPTITVLPGEASFPASSLEWEKASCKVAEKVIGIITLRDNCGNETSISDSSLCDRISGTWSLGPLWDRISVISIDGSTVIPTKHDNSKLYFEYFPIRSGAITLTVRADGTDRQTPTLSVKPGHVHWPSCEMRLLADSCIAGQNVRCEVHLRDVYGNVTSGVASSTEFIVTTTELQEGLTWEVAPVGLASEATLWTIDFFPTVAKAHRPELKIRSAPDFAGKQFFFSVISDTVNRETCVVKADTRKQFAGEKVTFRVMLLDKYKNPATTFQKYEEIQLRAENDGHEVAFVREENPAEAAVVVVVTPTRPGYLVLWVMIEKCVLSRHDEIIIAPGFAVWERSSIDLITNLVLSNLKEALTAGSECIVQLTPRDAYGNATVLSSGDPFEVTITFENAGQILPWEVVSGLKWRCVPVKVGFMTATVRRQGYNVEHTTQTPVIGGPADPSNSLIQLRPRVQKAGESIECIVKLSDKFGNAASEITPSDLSVVLSNSSSKLLSHSDIAAVSDSEFSFTFVPEIKGFVDVTVTVRRSRVQIETVRVEVVPGKVHLPFSSLRLGGVGMSTASAGNNVDFNFTLKDEYGNVVESLPAELVLEVHNEGHEITTIKTPSFSAGVFRGSFVPVGAGMALVTIGFPEQSEKLKAEVEVEPGSMHFPSCTMIIEAETLKVGQRTSLLLVTKDEYGNISKAANDAFEVIVVNGDERSPVELKGSDSSYSCVVRPTVAGTVWCEVHEKATGVVRKTRVVNVIA